jgi:23S rRNA (guanosine2251-2'-O)-methyltransferase
LFSRNGGQPGYPRFRQAAAGAFEYIKAARVTNLPRTIDELKEQGVWVFGADMQGEDYKKVDFSGPLALVIGRRVKAFPAL